VALKHSLDALDSEVDVDQGEGLAERIVDFGAERPVCDLNVVGQLGEGLDGEAERPVCCLNVVGEGLDGRPVCCLNVVGEGLDGEAERPVCYLNVGEGLAAERPVCHLDFDVPLLLFSPLFSLLDPSLHLRLQKVVCDRDHVPISHPDPALLWVGLVSQS